MKKYRVQLTEEEQQELRVLVSKGRAAAYKQTHARILLLSNEGCQGGAMKDEEISRSLQVGTATVERVRRRCVEVLMQLWGVRSSLTAARRNWTVKGKPTWLPWPVPNRHRAG